jgi:hypothetical protein
MSLFQKLFAWMFPTKKSKAPEVKAMAQKDIEKRVREERTLQAERNNLRGPRGKIGSIVRMLGQKMFFHIMEEPPLFPGDEPSPEIRIGEDQVVVDDDGEGEGWSFDGLKWGMHVEIIVNHPESRQTVYYKGYKVFEEIDGDLQVYVPFPEWETLIDKLYILAEKRRGEFQVEKEKEKQRKGKIKERTFWEKLRYSWGF